MRQISVFLCCLQIVFEYKKKIEVSHFFCSFSFVFPFLMVKVLIILRDVPTENFNFYGSTIFEFVRGNQSLCSSFDLYYLFCSSSKTLINSTQQVLVYVWCEIKAFIFFLSICLYLSQHSPTKTFHITKLSAIH